MALRNAWEHRLTAVQPGIAEADVTVSIPKVRPPQLTIRAVLARSPGVSQTFGVLSRPSVLSSNCWVLEV